MNYQELIERMRVLEIDHEPNGWPAIQMRDISAMCDAIKSLLTENARLKAECDDIKQVQFPRKLEAVAVGWKKQLATAQEEIQRMKRERLLTADAIESMHASHKGQLAKAEQRVVRQYYFKNNSCKAESAHDPDCICWHDEGTGPMQPLLDGTYLVQMTWRKFMKEM